MSYAVYSGTVGPDGNGILLPSDPGAGGHSGVASTANNTPTLCSGGFVPDDLKTTIVVATVQARTGPTNAAPTAAWSNTIKGTFIRDGNTVTQIGSGQSMGVESSPSLASVSARWIVDTSTTPNQIVPQVKGLAATAVSWAWNAQAPYIL